MQAFFQSGNFIFTKKVRKWKENNFEAFKISLESVGNPTWNEDFGVGIDDVFSLIQLMTRIMMIATPATQNKTTKNVTAAAIGTDILGFFCF